MPKKNKRLRSRHLFFGHLSANKYPAKQTPIYMEGEYRGMERERLGSRLGFILLSAGCAIGCGNVWKFPWMVGTNGGGAFVLLYILCLIVLGMPAMTMEFAMGRAAQASPVRMYHKLEKKGQKWHLHGYVALLGNVCLMAFYTVVTGWLIYYFVKFVTGDVADLGFAKMISNPQINVGFLAVAVIVGFVILTFDLQGGLERVTKYMMCLLIILMVVLAIKSSTYEGALQGRFFNPIGQFHIVHTVQPLFLAPVPRCFRRYFLIIIAQGRRLFKAKHALFHIFLQFRTVFSCIRHSFELHY